MEALAAIAGVSTGIGLIAVIVLAFKLSGAKDEQLAARDMLDQEREQHRKTRGELDVETAAHKATGDELRKEKALRADAEAQRNEAYRKEREDVVAIIEKSNVADAQRLVASLLARPLPGVVSGVLPARELPAPVSKGTRAEDPRDGLVDPFTVQPPTTP